MASGYLGKISAVVSANTAGYVRSLNEAAKETKSFAKAVQSDISRASNEAKRAFDSMYTPLQRVQRALQAASSQKLSFKGFDGGIKTIEQLKRERCFYSEEYSHCNQGNGQRLDYPVASRV